MMRHSRVSFTIGVRFGWLVLLLAAFCGSRFDMGSLVRPTASARSTASFCPVITVGPANIAPAAFGAVYTQSFTQSGGSGGGIFSMQPATVAGGLKLSSQGVLTGVPSQVGVFQFTVTVQDLFGCTGSRSYTLSIACPAASYSVSPASVKYDATSQSATIQVTTNAGCPWTAASNAPWIDIPFTTSGTGSLKVGYLVSPNNTGQQRVGTMTIAGKTVTVTQDGPACPALTVAPGALPSMTLGAPFSQALTGSGGKAPYSFATLLGSLPPGISLSANGVLSGTPISPGSWSFAVYVTDANGCTGSQTMTATVGAPACTYALSPASQSYAAAGGSGSVALAAGAGCAWTVQSNAVWLTPAVFSGSGGASIGYVVAPNNGAQRTGSLTIAGHSFSVTQDAFVQQPAPKLSSVNPNGAVAGSSALTIEVAGANFTGNSQVRWNNQLLPTSFIDATLLSATIPANDLAQETLADVTVFNPTTNQGSNGAPFRVFSSVANVSAASYLGKTLAPDSIVVGFGVELASATDAVNLTPLPTNRAGTSVRVIDSANVERMAPLFFVSPQQVNYLMPAGMAAGKAAIVVTSGTSHVSIGVTEIADVAPGVFTSNAQGSGTAAAQVVRVKSGGQQVYEAVAQNGQAVPIDLAVPGDQCFLVLYGTGLRHRSNLSAVTLTIAGVQFPALYAGESGLAGLDQVNVALPPALAGKGEVDVVLTVDGKAANPVKLTFK